MKCICMTSPVYKAAQRFWSSDIIWVHFHADSHIPDSKMVALTASDSHFNRIFPFVSLSLLFESGFLVFYLQALQHFAIEQSLFLHWKLLPVFLFYFQFNIWHQKWNIPLLFTVRYGNSGLLTLFTCIFLVQNGGKTTSGSHFDCVFLLFLHPVSY